MGARGKLVVKRDQHPYLVHVVLLSILHMCVIVCAVAACNMTSHNKKTVVFL